MLSRGGRGGLMLSRGMRDAVAAAVRAAGGTVDDARDLSAVWERLERDSQCRAGRIRAAAASVACYCADGGQTNDEARCERCYGRIDTGGCAGSRNSSPTVGPLSRSAPCSNPEPPSFRVGTGRGRRRMSHRSDSLLLDALLDALTDAADAVKRELVRQLRPYLLDDSRLLDAREKAAQLGIHHETLVRMARDGRVPGACKVGREWRFPPGEVEIQPPRDNCPTVASPPLPSAGPTAGRTSRVGRCHPRSLRICGRYTVYGN